MPVYVNDDGVVYEVEAIWNPVGYIRLHCHDNHGAISYVPRLTAQEARALADELIAAANIADENKHERDES